MVSCVVRVPHHCIWVCCGGAMVSCVVRVPQHCIWSVVGGPWSAVWLGSHSIAFGVFWGAMVMPVIDLLVTSRENGKVT